MDIKKKIWEHDRLRWNRIRIIGKWRFILMIALFFGIGIGTINTMIFLTVTYFFNQDSYYFYLSHLTHILLHYILIIIIGIIFGFFIWKINENKYLKNQNRNIKTTHYGLKI